MGIIKLCRGIFYFLAIMMTGTYCWCFYQAGTLPLVTLGLISGGVWAVFYKKIPYLCFTFTILLVLVGLFLKTDSFLMFIVFGLSIVLWELSLLELKMRKHADNKNIRTFYDTRIKALVMSLVISILIIFSCRLISFSVPFYLTVFLVIVSFFLAGKIIHMISYNYRNDDTHSG